MKNTITLFLFTIIIGLSLANAQTPDAYIENASSSVIVSQPFDNFDCCRIDIENPANTDLSCCQSSTWTINLNTDTNNIENTEYSRFILSVPWQARGSQSEFAWSTDAGITLRDPEFDDIVFLTPSAGARTDNQQTTITFEGEFPELYNVAEGNLQIDFFHYSAGDDYETQWNNVELKFYKPTNCDRPTAINDVAITSNRYDFEWTPAVNNNANQYYWQITPFSYSPLDDDCPVDSGTTAPGETAASSNKLMPGNPYILKIQSICDNESKSIFKDKIFKTIKDGTPPLNDDIANAIPVQNNCFYVGSTAEASLDEGSAPGVYSYLGPITENPINTNNVWYSYTGSGDYENVSLELCKSEDANIFPFKNLPLDDFYAADINVYKGSPGNLELVQFTNNDCPSDFVKRQPKLSFVSDGVTTYYISIDGKNSESGYFRLDVNTSAANNVQPPTNDEYTGATVLSSGNLVQANLKNATKSISLDVDTPCYDLEDKPWKDIWYKVTLNETSNLTVSCQDLKNNGIDVQDVTRSRFALYSKNLSGTVTWDTRIPILDAIDDIDDFDICVDQPKKTFTYKCLDEGEYFIRVFTKNNNNNNAAITATVESADGSANAGSLTAVQNEVILTNGTATISATNTDTVVPEGYEVLYVFSVLGSIDTRESTTPSFTMEEPGIYTIHTLVYDPSTIDIFDFDGDFDGISELLKNGCPDFDFTGATIEVVCPDFQPFQGNITANDSNVELPQGGGSVTIGASLNTQPVVPTDFQEWYVLTLEPNLIIQDISPTPSFDVSVAGDYKIHSFVAQTENPQYPNFLDLNTITFGTTSANDLLTILARNRPCAFLDVQGTSITVNGQTLSNDDVNDYGFSFQPNPVNTTLSLNAKQPINKVVLYTIQGQRVRSTSPNAMHSEIDMSGLANGLYFIEVSINNTMQTARIIKQ